MKYLEFTFTFEPATQDVADLLAAVLGEAGFDSFEGDERRPSPLRAYVRQDAFSQDALDVALQNFPMPGVQVSYTQREAEDKNWNEEWEKNYFQPLMVDGRCVVHSTFHKNVPQAEFDIVIDPRMSFGTGHHATTSQMISEILSHDFTGKRVLDMGCGTSILAILARMKGAAACVAIDNDEWCVKNSLENIALNHLEGIDVQLGDASSLVGQGPFDYIIANINRNILLADMRAYDACLAPGGHVFMSGFYREDVCLIREEAESLGWCYDHEHEQDRWACVTFVKKA